ncbi:MAG: hypothetical protein CVU77_04295 [Elusimicrobia bacterium HGW-Elusimicrobia-1]|jgi:hypothetical protein|nr:MAG: hypothetical protein CVU77_04295 [Elusimicrobia bacterium HGW-Elusimicrobia-1]
MKTEFHPKSQRKINPLICVAVYLAVALFIGFNHFSSYGASTTYYILSMTIPTVLLVIFLAAGRAKLPSIIVDDTTFKYGKTEYKREWMFNAAPFENYYNNALTDCGIEFQYDEGEKSKNITKKRASLIIFDAEQRKEIQKFLTGWIPVRKVPATDTIVREVAYGDPAKPEKLEWKFRLKFPDYIFMRGFFLFAMFFCGSIALFVLPFFYAENLKGDPAPFYFAVIFLGIASAWVINWFRYSGYVICVYPGRIIKVCRRTSKIKFSVTFGEVAGIEDNRYKAMIWKSRSLIFTMRDGKTNTLDITGYEKPDFLVQAVRDALNREPR